MQEINEIADIDKILRHCDAGNYIFRGTTKVYSNETDGINSSLYRWAKKQEVLFNKHYSPLDMEKEIVEKANRYFSPDTGNIEILTDLRHYGGNVTLIDFSCNLYVALFFACNGNFEADGELVALDTDKINKIEKIDYNAREAQTGVIDPANTQVSQRRIIAQSSVFVIDPNGYIDNNKCNIFRIKNKVKNNIIDYLRRFHNIDSHTIYNDLIGFITNEENYTSANVKFFMGYAKYEEQKHKEAIFHYNKAIKLDPQFIEAYSNRGIAKSALGQNQKAIEDYSKAIEINPQFSGAYYNRGVVKSTLGQKQEAIEDYSKAIEINPQYAKAYYNRGVAKSVLRKHEEAIEDYSKVIEINPQNADAYNNRGTEKSALWKYEEAIEDCNKAIEINPQFAEAYCNRSAAKSALGQNQEAIEDYNKAIEINPQFAGAYNGRGGVKHGLGQNQEAIEDYSKAIEINPQNAVAYYNRGNVKAALGQTQEAIEDHKKAIELDPKLANKK